MFQIPIQAAIGHRPRGRARLPQGRDRQNATAAMPRVGATLGEAEGRQEAHAPVRVDIPQDAFVAALKVDV
jgi:translation elongation factor EF-4